jgi:putative ABC transport system permease protein
VFDGDAFDDVGDVLAGIRDLLKHVKQFLPLDDHDRIGLGLEQPADRFLIRVVGLVNGLKSIAGPYVFCSLPTARKLTNLGSDQTVYVLAHCDNPKDAEGIVKALKDEYVNEEDSDMSVFTKNEFSFRSRLHWLTKTKAGIALGYAAFLGLVVGAVVTSQTLYAATMASMREYAILLALGIPRWRLRWTVVTQAFWIGVFGVLLSVPATMLMAELASQLGVKPQLSPELITAGPSHRSRTAAGMVIAGDAAPVAARFRRFVPGLPNGAVAMLSGNRLPEP